MSQELTTFDLLVQRFAPRLMVGIPEVAEVLRGRSDHAAREAIRAAIAAGDVLKGLRKTRGDWLVPLRALADWIDGRVAEVEEPSAPRRSHHAPAPPAPPPPPSAPRRRGRLPDSVRLPARAARLAAQRERAGLFFQQVRAFIDRGLWGVADVPRSRRVRP